MMPVRADANQALWALHPGVTAPATAIVRNRQQCFRDTGSMTVREPAEQRFAFRREMRDGGATQSFQCDELTFEQWRQLFPAGDLVGRVLDQHKGRKFMCSEHSLSRRYQPFGTRDQERKQIMRRRPETDWSRGKSAREG